MLLNEGNASTSNEPEILYHYSGLDAFLSIIESKTLRLTDVCKSTDYLETKALLPYVKTKALENLDKNFRNFNDVIIYGMNTLDALDYLLSVEIDRILKDRSALLYAACFSTKGNDLGQWREYANKGKGISIGFNTLMLKKLCAENEIFANKESILLEPVRYVKHDYSDLPETLVNACAENVCRNICHALSNNNMKGFLNNEFGLIENLNRQIILDSSIFYKQEAFSSEMEWRIVYRPDLEKCDEWSCFGKHIGFKSTDDDIKSFLNLSFDNYLEDIISEIYIGPDCRLSDEDVSQILTRYGYGCIDIKHSLLSYGNKA